MVSPSTRYVIGIDEAGRGPLAGPVVVAGVGIAASGMRQAAKALAGIMDSKKLSAKKREEWFGILTRHPEISYAVARVWPKTIDRINIARAANLGARRVFCALAGQFFGEDRVGHFFRYSGRNDWMAVRTFLDGGLRLSDRVPHEVIIKGDEKIPMIAAASIIAKVTRDRIMCRLHKKYPRYGFDRHKGYGTRMHRECVARFGISEIHRKSFRFDSKSAVV